MNQSQRIAKNIIALTFSTVFLAVCLFIFNIFVARYLGDVEFGKYSFALAFTCLFVVFSQLGLDAMVTRDVVLDKSQARRYFSNALFLKAIGSVSMLLLIIVAVNLAQLAPDTRVIVYIVAIGTIMMSFIELCRSIFRAFARMEWAILGATTGGCLLLAVGIFALRSGCGLIEIACIFSAAHVLMFFIGFAIVTKKITGLTFRVELSFWRHLLVSTIPFALNEFLFSIYHRVDIVMLSFLKDEAVVGWYNAACILSITPLLLVAAGVVRALFPSIAHAFEFNRGLYTTLVERAVRYLMILLIPIGVGVTLLASKMIFIVFGPQFANSTPALQVLIWAGISLFFGCLYIDVMQATGKQKRATLLLGIGAVVNIVMNLLLIPRFSLVGAAIATLVTQITCLMLACYIVGRASGMRLLANSTIRPVIASAIMGAFVFWLSNLHIILLIFLAVIIYFLVLYMLGGITKEDRETLRDLINPNRGQR